ncbi:MAG: FtsH protease activity modulator HflK [Gammaproteobacteria bacterium]|nr:FtsH protease activity modulator HflK [Gammaproteobacteria bacterium]NNF60298.1 FtsH protease activity modulator HflK [Gammaproteobacteria bacterium]NNM20406.1 FtsH protease activity modulator HflK [Gammaproteobacteria bacterium]
MAWNEPGKGRDPWGGNGQQRPPDLDELVRSMQQRLRGLFGGGGSGGGGGAAGTGPTLLLFLVALLVGLLLLSAYRIDAPEQGVVLRLGAYNRTSPPGLHFRIPLVETIEKVNIAQIENYDYRNQMLTSDENIVFIEGNVQYRRGEPRDYLFSVRGPEMTVEDVAESAIREVVGKNRADYILGDGRPKVAEDASELMQQTLDLYNTGIVVTQFNLKRAQPPPEVQAAVDDATKAREDKDRFRLAAEAYANDLIPRARGAAARQMQEAEAYRERVIADAEGEAARFESLLTEYEKAPEVTRQRLYLEAVEEVLAANSKVLIDSDSSGGNLLYLPMDKLLDRQREGSASVDSIDRGGSSARANSPENPRARESARTRGER